MACFLCPVVSGQAGAYTTEPRDNQWIEDMEGKVDATINVLSVLKEELEQEKKSREQPVDTSEDAWVDSLRKNIKRIKRLWEEINKMQEEERRRAGTPAARSPGDAGQWADDMKNKLDKSIKAMQVIKEELDAMERE
jgi:hypothetical protein